MLMSFCRHKLLLSAIALGCIIPALSSYAEDGATPVQPAPWSIFEKSLMAIDATHLDSIEKCRNSYAAALNAAETAATQKGDLDAVVKIRKEKERFNQDRAVDDEIPADINPLIKQAMQAYLRDINAAESTRANSIKDLANKYLSHLESTKIRLTKEKKIEEALEVQKDIDRAKSDPVITEALSQKTDVSVSVCTTCSGTGIRHESCPDCKGSKICNYCQGAGKRPGLGGSMVSCFACTGSGKCKKCQGSGETSSTCPDCFGTGRSRK